MRSVELAVLRYIEAWTYRDREARQALLDACFAVDGRLVGTTRTFRGRAEVAAMMETALADPRGLRARRTSAIDVVRGMFRFRSLVEFDDGSPAIEGLDVGEVDGQGRISVLYAFSGPLRDAIDAP